MKLKTLIVSVVVLAALSLAVFLATRPGQPPSQDARLGQPLIDRATVEKAAKLQISDQGKTIALARQADGTWRDTSYFDLPADFSKLTGFVSSLTEAKLDRLVTTNPDRIARLEFKDTKIELRDAADKPLWSVTLGKSAEIGGGRFLRFDDEKKAYLANLNAWLDTDAKNWANAELLNLKADDVAKIEIEFPAAPAGDTTSKTAATPASTVVISREKKDAAWTSRQTPANEKVKADRVSSLLNEVGNVRFSDTSDPSDPNVAVAKAHSRTFKLTTFDGKTYTVTFGRKPEEKKLKPATAPKSEATAEASTPAAAKAGKAAEKKANEAKPAAPEYETIPAGPAYTFISSSDASAPVNALMQKRAFQVSEYIFTGLPQKPEELFEPAPKPEEKKADEKKAEPAPAPAKPPAASKK
jgi:hypothetical protein